MATPRPLKASTYKQFSHANRHQYTVFGHRGSPRCPLCCIRSNNSGMPEKRSESGNQSSLRGNRVHNILGRREKMARASTTGSQQPKKTRSTKKRMNHGSAIKRRHKSLQFSLRKVLTSQAFRRSIESFESEKHLNIVASQRNLVRCVLRTHTQ